MTARRRRKVGSGPSATALIAWVGGAQAAAGVSGAPVWSSGRHAVLVGRALGLAAGTVLACGSVLASAVQVGDGSPTGDSAALPSYPPVTPGPVLGAVDEYGESAAAARMSAAPVAVSPQAFVQKAPATSARPARVYRNKPVSVDASAETGAPPRTGQPPWHSSAPPADHPPAGPITPVNPVLDPAAAGVDRVTPVGEVLEPPAAREKRSSGTAAAVPVQEVVPVVEDATRPAMAMLGGLLPGL
ncbi:MAG: hypothetical protein ACRDSR_06880 [Pseudonocardiaceae bacterium]